MYMCVRMYSKVQKNLKNSKRNMTKFWKHFTSALTLSTATGIAPPKELFSCISLKSRAQRLQSSKSDSLHPVYLTGPFQACSHVYAKPNLDFKKESVFTQWRGVTL